MTNIPKIVKRTIPDDHNSGSITLQGSKVIWHNDDLVFLQLDINDVVVIGEYTNSNGPWFDDWFLTFVIKNGEWMSIPWYANNIERLLDVLATRFDPSLKDSHLTNSTSWKSIIRYPIELEGIELFNKIPTKNYNPPMNLLQKLLYSLGIGKFNLEQEIELSNPVKVEIAKACA